MILKRNLFSRLYGPAEDGGEHESSGGAIGTGNDARVALLAEIENRVNEDRGDELQNVNNDDTTEPFQEPKSEDKSEEDNPDSKAPQEEIAPPTTVKLKVNGKELELSLEEVIARAQKVESADEYLREAAARKRESEAEEVAPEPTAREEAVDLKALARAIQVGSEEEAVAALQKLQSLNRPSQPDDVSRVVDARLSFRDAMNAFRTEFKDVVSDPRLNALAMQMDDDQLRKGDKRSYAERYAEIGTELRKWVATIKGPSATPLEARAEKKAQAAKEEVPPTAAAGKNSQAKEEPEEDDSPAAVVAKMAAARGGPQWMRG